MNASVEKVRFDAEIVNSLMYAFEATFADGMVIEGDEEKTDMALYSFYGIWDSVKKLIGDIEVLQNDCRVVDAIAAASKCITEKQSA